MVEPEAPRSQIAACRRSDVAAVRQELSPGADSVAARIVDRDGYVAAALSVVVRGRLDQA
jgi:DNA-binding IclR family transcriptional regulator